MPIRSFLESEAAGRLLAGTPFAAFVVCRRYWRNNLKTVSKLGTRQGGGWLDGMHFTFAGGQTRSFLSLVSYLGKGENRGRYLGVRIPPSNLMPDYAEAARNFAARLADRLDNDITGRGDTAEGKNMAIGPVQLIVLGFERPEFHGEIIAELERLRDSDVVRVIDALAVHKDAAGEIEVMHLSNLSKDEAIELGSKVAALVGLGIDGEEGMVAGAEAGAEAAGNGVQVFSDDEAWDVLEEIPNDSAAALILLEHHWAVPLRDAIARAGGFRISDGFISPLDLVEIGLVSREEAEKLHTLETTPQPA
jgi:uncharacterized membrane protein